MAELHKPQPFPHEATANNESQPFLEQIIINWASKLPNSPLGILDLASGIGLETNQLSQQGYPCILQDASIDMLLPNNGQPKITAAAESLPYPSNSFSGALLKDALILLSEKQRPSMLEEVQRTLVKKGSLFIISEYNHSNKAIYQPGIYIDEPREKILDSKFTLFWEKKVLANPDYFQSFEYKTTHKSMKKLAKLFNFEFQLMTIFSGYNQLALECRWPLKEEAGFIVKLTKK